MVHVDELLNIELGVVERDSTARPRALAQVTCFAR